MKRIKLILRQERDQRGELEEFTNDLFLVVTDEHLKTAHLHDDGLPQIGTRVVPGMLLVGKLGTTTRFSPDRLPNDLETLTMKESSLIQKYGDMFYDASLYVPQHVCGVVMHAYFEAVGRHLKMAVVEIQNES
jgi:DNA-directed RNA polymerase beta subunit